MVCLKDSIDKVYIVSNKLDIRDLADTLSKEGFSWKELRQEDLPRYKGYSKAYRCLLNHEKAWKEALNHKFTLVVEEDFVPVRELGNLPLPFKINNEVFGMCWLYSCGPRMYSVSKEGNIEGGTTSMVAYIINQKSARILLDFAERIKSQTKGSYSTWDSETGLLFLKRGMKNYISFRNYGEHGGSPNPEHSENKIHKGTHRADVLYGPLAFKPQYAKDSTIRYWGGRMRGKIKGIGRLLLGRFVHPKTINGSSFPFRLIRKTIARYFTLRL